MPPARAGQASPEHVPWILYGALWTSTLLYLVILWVQQPQLADLPGPDSAMVFALALAAAGSAVTSFLLPRHLHRVGLAQAELEVEEVPDPDASVMFRDQTPTIRVFAAPEAARRKARQLFFTPFILRLALAEAIAVYGLVLGMQGASWGTVLPFFVACWAIFAVSSPRRTWIYGALERARDARFPEDAG